MKKLSWLVYSSDEDALRRGEARRTRQASDDLFAFADRIRPHGLHLVIEDAVDIEFDLQERHLPPGTVDGRGRETLTIALDDPSAIVITAGGFFVGLSVGFDPRWKRLAELGRSRGILGSNALSGRYYGLTVDGPLAIRYSPEDLTRSGGGLDG